MAKYDGWFMTFGGHRGVLKWNGALYERIVAGVVMGYWDDAQIKQHVGDAKLEPPKTSVLKDYFCL